MAELSVGDTVRVTGPVMTGNVGTVVTVDDERGYLVRVGGATQNWFAPGDVELFRP